MKGGRQWKHMTKHLTSSTVIYGLKNQCSYVYVWLEVSSMAGHTRNGKILDSGSFNT